MPHHTFEDCPLAVIGMACRFPGAEDLDAYWQLIVNGRSAITEVPASRFDAALYYHPDKGVRGKSYCKIGGVVSSRPLDRQLCPVSDELLAGADQTHLGILEVAARAFRHAHLDPFAVPLRNTGVFVGHARGSPLSGDLAYATHIEAMVEYLRELDLFRSLPAARQEAVLRDMVETVHREKPQRGLDGKPDIECSRVAGLLTQAFGLTGPYMAVDAACASSLYALAMAANALHQGRIDMALVGGTSYLSWFSMVVFSQAQALSAQGSFPFDARADGFVGSDGYAAVLLKPLPRALADGDPIQGVIRGLGVSCDGRGKSLWAPRKEGQVEAIARAYHRDLDPASVQYIEAHGTSTRLGDATEVEALCDGLGKHVPRGTRLPMGSVKANIGHTREVAGLAGLIKTLLAMQHGVIPPAANFETPSPQIPWDAIPLVVPTASAEWERPTAGQPRRAVVDAFGIGGINVHMVVEDFQASPLRNADCGLRIADKRSLAEPIPSELGGNPQSAMGNSAMQPVAIIGMGGIFPGARTIGAYWDLLRSGRSALTEVPRERWNADIFYQPGLPTVRRTPAKVGGFITDFAYDWKTHKIPPRQVENADPLQFMLLDAADQALRDAGLDRRPFDRRRTGVIVGSGFAGDFAGQLNRALRLPEFQKTLARVLCRQEVAPDLVEPLCAAFAELFLRHHGVIHDETGSYTASTLASRINKTFDFMGGTLALDAGGASSLVALGAAVDMLRAGAWNVALCAGAHRTMDIGAYEGYALRGWLAPDTPRAGFDARACGFVPGEGVGVVVLKRLEDARRDGDPIRAIIHGVGTVTASQGPGPAMRRAMEQAVSASGIQPTEMAFVEPAGLSVPAVDAAEIEAVTAVYGSEKRKRPLLLGSLVGQIGYTQAASGMAALLKTTLALEHGQVPASVGLTGPVEPIAQRSETMTNVTDLRALANPDGQGRLFAAVSAHSLGGQYCHVCLERPPAVASAQPAPRPHWRILRLGAPSLPVLVERIAQYQDKGETLYAAAPLAHFGDGDRARLAIVADTPSGATRKLRLAAEQLAQPQARLALEEQGIFFREMGTKTPRCALLFPGQGSQYPGMLRELIAEVPAATAMRNEIEALLTQLGYPTFTELAWENTVELGSDVWRTQLAVLLADTIVHAALMGLGLLPDVLSGHSYGEYAALVAAGAWTLEQALSVTRARCDAIEASQVQGVMLSTTASVSVIERLAASLNGSVCVANWNAPDQTVVAGRVEAVNILEARLASKGFDNQWLPVPRPFHSPMMAPVQADLARALESETIWPPRIPLLSSVTNRFTSDPVEIRSNLVEQLTRPVRYTELIGRLADQGVTVFVEVGPRQVLTRLHRRILDGREVALIACDNPRRPGLEQLVRVQALLECAGVPLGTRHHPSLALRAGVGHQPDAKARGHASPALRAGIGPIERAIVHFDATERRRQRMRQRAEEAKEPSVPQTPAVASPPADELEAFLVTFVCEQTGYPPEIVDLDADFEADLGIDSIKRAQLIGELREHFDLQVTGNLSLADFPTLRHVLELLRKSNARLKSKPEQAAGTADPIPPAPKQIVQLMEEPLAPASPVNRHTTEDADCTEKILNAVHLAGTPYEMGLQHAQSQYNAIKTMLNRYTDHLGPRLETMGVLYQALTEPERYIDAAGLEEIRGLADGLQLPADLLISCNLGMYGEYVPGCVQFAATARHRRGAGLIHATNEDWVLALVLPDCLTRLVQVRHPRAGIPHLTFSIAGQLGGINGMNARGLAVTSTLLLDRPRRPTSAAGKMHSVIVRNILQQATDLESAVEVVRSMDRTGAWSLCLSHHLSDRLCYLEYDEADLKVQVDPPTVLSTNHCQLFTSRVSVPSHSRHRLQRLEQLLGVNGRDSYTADQARAALRDGYDVARERVTPHPTMNTIRRVDNQISIVMRPAQGELWVTPGPLVEGKEDLYYRLDVNGLLAPRSTDGGATPARSASEGLSLADATVRIPTEARSASEGPSLADASGFQMISRFVLRMVEAPLEDAGAQVPSFHGPVLLLGQNPTATSLRERLKSWGATVLQLPVGDVVEQTLAALENQWSRAAAPYLFVLTARDEDAAAGLDAEAWSKRRQRGLLLPYLVCQRWVKLLAMSGLVDQATLVGVTGLGGDFGFSGHGLATEGGGLAGLFKGVAREFDRLRVKMIDAPPEEAPAILAAAVGRELAAGQPEIEVGYVRGRRRTVRAIPRPVAHQHDAPAKEIAHGGTWVVTGGARGITALVARALGERYGLKLHLLGRTPLPSQDAAWRGLSAADLKKLKMSMALEARRAGRDAGSAWSEVERAMEIDRNLAAFAERGIHVRYHACNVSDWAALAQVLECVRRENGPIQGILHGAGIEEAARFENKLPHKVTATIAAKVDGAAALMALTRQDPLAYFVAFGSISGRFGGHGQTDYSLASDMLAKMIGRFRAERPECTSVAFHWPAWNEAGMAVRPQSKVVLEALGQRFMSPAEGIDHLLDELRAGAPEAEVLILDQSHPAQQLDPDHILPSTVERNAYTQRDALVVGLPLIEGVHDLREGRGLRAELRLDPMRDPFLVEHRFHGVPLMPAVISLEAFAEAAALLFPGRPVAAYRKIEVVNGFRFYADRPQEACVWTEQTPDGMRCEVKADFYNRDGKLTDPGRVYVKGLVDLVDATGRLGPLTYTPIPAMVTTAGRMEPPIANWHPMEYLTREKAEALGRIYIGPPLQTLRSLSLERTGCWIKIDSPPLPDLAGPGRNGAGWLLPSAVLDACFQAAGVFLYLAFETVQLPRSMDSIRWGRLPRPGEKCLARLDMLAREERHTLFNIAVFGEDGEVLILVEGFRNIIVSQQGSR
jgi:acyl transferase domain-containing protein/NAD(P)-dependent dehydrogenase (short-subunit alcohol dehydrogenase family)